MDITNTPTPSSARETDIAAATAHLKESWEQGKEAASDAQRIARKSLDDLSRSVDQYFESRPRTIALWALGTGLARWVSSPASSWAGPRTLRRRGPRSPSGTATLVWSCENPTTRCEWFSTPV